MLVSSITCLFCCVAKSSIHMNILILVLMGQEHLLRCFTFFTGMRVQTFKGLPFMKTVECSGERLGPDTTLLAITMFAGSNNDVLAYINLRDNLCSTSAIYSACVIDVIDYRKTRLVVLVTDLRVDEPREYKCNVTSFRAGHSHVITWTLRVDRWRT